MGLRQKKEVVKRKSFILGKHFERECLDEGKKKGEIRQRDLSSTKEMKNNLLIIGMRSFTFHQKKSDIDVVVFCSKMKTVSLSSDLSYQPVNQPCRNISYISKKVAKRMNYGFQKKMSRKLQFK